MSSSVLRLHGDDNVVVAIRAITENEEVHSETITSRTAVPEGHKIATKPIAKGETVIKYGQIIGVATADIQVGDHVHTHNMGMYNYDRSYDVGAAVKATDFVPVSERASFDGIVRANGRVGTRNFIGVMATSHCSSGVVKFITEAFDKRLLAEYPNVDGVVPIIHHSGCGLADHGDGIEYLRRTLVGWAEHPNFAGIVVVGHGC